MKVPVGKGTSLSEVRVATARKCKSNVKRVWEEGEMYHLWKYVEGARKSTFRLKSPFRHHPNNHVSQAIFDEASAMSSNIALHIAYAKQKRLSTLLDSSSLYINEIINEPSPIAETFVFLNELFHKKTFILLCQENKKLHRLVRNSPMHSSLQDQKIIPDFLTNKKPSMHFRKQTKISTVFNLSDIKLSVAQSSLLEKGISFYPTHKLDLVELYHEINVYTSLLRNKEFFIQKILHADQTDQLTLSKQPQTGQHHQDAIITSTLTFTK